MKQMKFSGISVCWQCVVLGMICAVMSACSAESPPVTAPSAQSTVQQGEPVVEMESQNAVQVDTIVSADNTGHLTVSVQAFLRELLSLNKNVAGGGNFNLPAIWIFSPQGELVNIVQDEQALEAFQLEFPAIDPQVPNIACQSMEQSVTNAANAVWNMGCADGKWIALSLSPTRCGEHCTKSKNVLAHMEQVHQGALQVRMLLVEFGR